MFQHFLILKFYWAKNYEEYIGECGGEQTKTRKKMVYMCIENVTAITKNKINIKTLEINIVIIVINAISIHNK